MNAIYVVLEYFNEYEQHGGYFRGVFNTWDEALSHIGEVGRISDEYSWYEIEPVAIDKFYDEGDL